MSSPPIISANHGLLEGSSIFLWLNQLGSWMEYKFVTKAHESSHVREGISAQKTHFDKNKMFKFKRLSCDVVTCDIRLVS